VGIKLGLLKDFTEVSPFVSEALGLNHPHTLDVLFDKVHVLFFAVNQPAKLTIFGHPYNIIQEKRVLLPRNSCINQQATL
jgi:hypothetical protein